MCWGEKTSTRVIEVDWYTRVYTGGIRESTEFLYCSVAVCHRSIGTGLNIPETTQRCLRAPATYPLFF